ncbi:hypothetical protein VP01_3355g1 [Puccinia sorghi]|uniref:Reverse transcriptase Ty1/copia-type domain-containing protein n=1 Tax=Puccinia sorghi TaxID=27349 RepID=A0A0L6UWY3_9BASI|nr:hypothetical protein VP01_3355g1 [Puccinia sorghi]
MHPLLEYQETFIPTSISLVSRFIIHLLSPPQTLPSQCNDAKYWKQAIKKKVDLIEDHCFWEDDSKETPNPLSPMWAPFFPKDVFTKTPKRVNRPTPYPKLNKFLYGLKQYPKNWYETLTGWLQSIGFLESSLILPATTKCKWSSCMWMISYCNSSFHKPKTILGMKYERENEKIKLSLPKNIEHSLEELGLTNCKSSVTPLTPNLKIQEAPDEDHAQFKKLNIKYRLAMVKPGITHWHKVKNVWQSNIQINSSKSTATPPGVDPQDQTSQSGYLCFLFGTIISGKSLKQQCVTYSSTEAELNPLVDAFHEGIWLKALLAEIWNIQLDAAIHVIENPNLNEQLMMKDEQFKENFAKKHLIDNKGSRSLKTCHINLRNKGI